MFEYFVVTSHFASYVRSSVMKKLLLILISRYFLPFSKLSELEVNTCWFSLPAKQHGLICGADNVLMSDAMLDHIRKLIVAYFMIYDRIVAVGQSICGMSRVSALGLNASVPGRY
jgi:hypothetical protein